MKNNKSKRYYKVGEKVWSIDLKSVVEIVAINKDGLTVDVKNEKNEIHTFQLWRIDVLKYKAKTELVKSKNEKVTYLSSVKGGVIPTKDEENAGRDCYARLEPKVVDGKEVYELFIKQLTLAKIPLGFASFLDKKDLLSLKHERSSIGGTGLINLSGLIDSTYQGEVILQVVPLTSDILITSEVDEKEYDKELNLFKIPYRKAIAQAVILEQSQAKDVEIDYDVLLNMPSKRGLGKEGSSGK